MISFGAYSLVNLLPVGVKVVSAGAFIWTAVVVWFMAYITNHLELRRYIKEKERKDEVILKHENKGDKNDLS